LLITLHLDNFSIPFFNLVNFFSPLKLFFIIVEDSTVRVTNLPEETIEDDLREIFRRFGSIVRIYLSRDRKTGFCKGFAFVSFETKEEAERALRVNGHGYQNLIMRVEMSEPSSSSST